MLVLLLLLLQMQLLQLEIRPQSKFIVKIWL